MHRAAHGTTAVTRNSEAQALGYDARPMRLQQIAENNAMQHETRRPEPRQATACSTHHADNAQSTSAASSSDACAGDSSVRNASARHASRRGLPAQQVSSSKARARPIKRLMNVALLALAFTSQSASTTPVDIAGLRFNDAMVHEGATLQRRGAGLLTYFFIKAYASALYLPATVPANAYKADVAKCLEIAYLVDIDGADFGPAGEKVLARTIPAAQLRALRPQFDALNRAYVDVKKGDRYSLCYAPGKGTTLKLTGRALTTVPGADFGALYYDIWLGAKPVDKGLRNKLLGAST